MSAQASRNRHGEARHPLEAHRDTAAHRLRVALSLCSALVLLLLVWSTWGQLSARLGYEKSLAAQVTATTANIFTRDLQELDARLQGFVNQEKMLLSSVASAPGSTELRDSLWSLVQLVFPDVQAALVLDAGSGHTVSLGSGMGDDGLLHLRQFVRSDAPSMRFGGRNDVENTDVFAAWYSNGTVAGGLAVRMSCAELCRPLHDSVPEHHLLRLLPASGGRPAKAQGTLLARRPLGDTGWVLEERLAPDYLTRMVRDRAALALLLGLSFLLAATTLYQWARRGGAKDPRGALSLREDRLKLRAVLAATTEGIVLTNSEGRIELFNPAAEMMFGRLTEDVLNANVSKLLPDFFAGPGAEAVAAQSKDLRAPPLVRESRGLRKGGTEFPLRLWISGLRLDDAPRLLIVVQDLTEQSRNEEKLAFLEQRDVLTGLLNRKAFERQLADLLADEQSGAGVHSLCYVDVDQFKLVNDTCGHDAGDELLKQIAVLFEAKLTNAEIIARLGSDEFAALFRDQTVRDSRKACEGFMQTVRNFLFTWRDQSFDVAVSIGLLEFTAASDSASSALSKGDVACEMAKRHGRDRIHVYHEGDAELVRHHGDMRLVSEISRALNEGRFHLYAQPIVPIGPGAKLRHFEVLVRMVDEDGSPVIPDKFIPAAERYILMPAVDRWIINRLFSLQAENLRAWFAERPESFLFAVNLSGTSITDEGFLRYLKRQFAEWDVPFQTICFEITETAAVRRLEPARAFMNELAALGCSFALDDFGTGLSSYRYLRELPVDYLKIDGSFVRGMTDDPVNYALVESINQIGHVLGLKTIAEWAEDKATVNQLRALNVDFAQGFAVGEPIPVCDLTPAHAVLEPSPRTAAP